MSTLTKRDLLWVALRVFWIYLLVCAIQALPTLALGLFYWSLSPLFHPGEEPLVTRQIAAEQGLRHVASAAVEIVVYSASAFYFLMRGSWLMRVASGDDPSQT